MRGKLFEAFAACGIYSCEARLDNNCTGMLYIGHAHRVKRRYIRDLEELKMTALLCQSCHSVYEFGDKQVMYDAITKIIENRSCDVTKYL